MPDSKDLPIQSIKGVGPQKARLLAHLGIRTIADAFLYLPRRYEDRSAFRPISSLHPGERATLSVSIVSLSRSRGKKAVLNAVVTDGASFLKLVWFNQPYLARSLRIGQAVVITGAVKENRRDLPPLMIESPELELLAGDADDRIHSGRVVPFYGLTEGLGQKQLRKIMYAIVETYSAELDDALPDDIRQRQGLPPLQETVRQLHFPSSGEMLESFNRMETLFHRRIVFEELFLFGLGLALLKRSSAGCRGIRFRSDGALKRSLIGSLPYALTAAQRRVIEEVGTDMRSSSAMHRLIQGDVGCGKTTVAVAAMLDAVEAGYQAALMAPTAILAEQHYQNLRELLKHLGLSVMLVSGGAVSGDSDSTGRITADIVIGTHALIQEGVRFRKLGLAVIDEQHKFGVLQRGLLRKKGVNPDLLVMTATPIPRSLALTLYGDLDCSVVDELPPGRKPVATSWVAAADREKVYELLRQEVSQGRQAYVVYPAIEESETLNLKNAISGAQALGLMFPQFRTALLHGRMKTEERAEIMGRFKRHEVDILVSTTVIEVGVNVPNAAVMVVVHAERFGLSQLHQLRGRVGRGAERSFCVLVAYDPVGEDAARRLDIMAATNDGFRIAEEDLSIRGPGEFLGLRQSGLPDLLHADIIRDAPVLEAARSEASALAARDPELKELPFLKKRLDVFWKGKAELFKTG